MLILFRFGIVLFSFCICSSDLEPSCFLVGRNKAIKSRCSLKNVMGHLKKVINRKNKSWVFISFFNCPLVCGLSPSKSRECCAFAASRSHEDFDWWTWEDDLVRRCHLW